MRPSIRGCVCIGSSTKFVWIDWLVDCMNTDQYIEYIVCDVLVAHSGF